MRWIDADEALTRMGTRPQTLYANVSRGRIRSRRDPADSRKSLYAEDDIERLAARRRGRRPKDELASGTIRWGEPVLSSGISTIVDGRLYYRGKDAVALSDKSSFEQVAGLLWQAGKVDMPEQKGHDDPTGLAGALQMLAQRAAHDLPTLGRSNRVLIGEARSILADVSTALSGSSGDAVHERLARVWERGEAADPIRRALVLLADHELNASTFAARVTASTGASLAASVLAGMSALSGPLHGGAASAAASFLRRAEQHGAREAVREWLAAGSSLPAFGHKLYPDGDIRASAILDRVELTGPMAELREVAEEMTGEVANVDFALLALKNAHGLPEEAPMLIFSLARTAGWLAHALEQAESGHLIRPRARYSGPPIDRIGEA